MCLDVMSWVRKDMVVTDVRIGLQGGTVKLGVVCGWIKRTDGLWEVTVVFGTVAFQF